jgi:hypothetical protein
MLRLKGGGFLRASGHLSLLIILAKVLLELFLLSADTSPSQLSLTTIIIRFYSSFAANSFPSGARHVQVSWNAGVQGMPYCLQEVARVAPIGP